MYVAAPLPIPGSAAERCGAAGSGDGRCLCILVSLNFSECLRQLWGFRIAPKAQWSTRFLIVLIGASPRALLIFRFWSWNDHDLDFTLNPWQQTYCNTDHLQIFVGFPRVFPRLTGRDRCGAASRFSPSEAISGLGEVIDQQLSELLLEEPLGMGWSSEKFLFFEMYEMMIHGICLDLYAKYLDSIDLYTLLTAV